MAAIFKTALFRLGLKRCARPPYFFDITSCTLKLIYIEIKGLRLLKPSAMFVYIEPSESRGTRNVPLAQM